MCTTTPFSSVAGAAVVPVMYSVFPYISGSLCGLSAEELELRLKIAIVIEVQS